MHQASARRVCRPPSAPFHARSAFTEEIKECNMYKLGFCIYGPSCRYKHKPMPGARWLGRCRTKTQTCLLVAAGGMGGAGAGLIGRCVPTFLQVLPQRWRALKLQSQRTSGCVTLHVARSKRAPHHHPAQLASSCEPRVQECACALRCARPAAGREHCGELRQPRRGWRPRQGGACITGHGGWAPAWGRHGGQRAAQVWP